MHIYHADVTSTSLRTDTINKDGDSGILTNDS